MTNKELEALILQMEEMNAPEQDIADVVLAHEQGQDGSVANTEREQQEEEAINTRKEERKKRRQERKKDKAPQQGVDAEQGQLASEQEFSTTALQAEDIDWDLLQPQGEDYMGIQFQKDLETERLIKQNTFEYLQEFQDNIDIVSSAKGTEEQWAKASLHPNFVKMYEDIWDKNRNAEGFLGKEKVRGGWGVNGDNWLNASDLPEGEEGDRIFLNYIGVGANQGGKVAEFGLTKNHNGYYGADKYYAQALDEVWYLRTMHEIANVYEAQMPGLNVEDMNPAEIISMYHSGAWKAKREIDERGDLTFDVEYNLEIHNTLANKEMEADLAYHMGTVMVPFEEASREQSMELQQTLSEKYVALS